MSKKSLIIRNPISGPKSNKFIVDKLEKKFKSLNINYEILQTEYKGHAELICANKEILLYENIIICGGDGTFNEVINGLIKNHQFNIPTIGFLPGGTGNAFMHDLEATNPDEAIDLIINKNEKKIDVLQLNFKKNIEYSINIVGWGMVTDILILSEKMRFLRGIRYTVASLFYVFKKSIKNISVIIDNKQLDKTKFIFILITNTIHTGKGMKAAPNALLDDGLLDVIFLKSNISKFQLLLLLPKLFSGKHIDSPYVKYVNVKNIELVPEVNEVLNVDGEVKGQTPVKVTVLPRSLSIYSK